MANKVIKITANLPIIPDWLKINNSITIPLPLKSAKELAQKTPGGPRRRRDKTQFCERKKTTVEIDWESEKRNNSSLNVRVAATKQSNSASGDIKMVLQIKFSPKINR